MECQNYLSVQRNLHLAPCFVFDIIRFSCFTGRFFTNDTAPVWKILPTPAGYRGEGVFDNFWKLIERWQTTFIIAVPTAISALMQRPVDADVSSVKKAFSGSSPVRGVPTRCFQTRSECSRANSRDSASRFPRRLTATRNASSSARPLAVSVATWLRK